MPPAPSHRLENVHPGPTGGRDPKPSLSAATFELGVAGNASSPTAMVFNLTSELN